MAQRVFIKVIGFTDVERHALNALFRLSEGRETIYTLWLPDAPQPPALALIDGESYEGRFEAESPGTAGEKFIWVGPRAPANAWRAFERPLSWPDIVQVMDEEFAAEELVDFDLDFDALDTQPPPFSAPTSSKRALIAAADRDARLYLRAKLALAHLTVADEAETGARALELARDTDYAVALVDFALPDFDGWEFLRELKATRRRIPRVIVTKAHASAGEWLRARLAGTYGFFGKPPHPGKLHQLLVRI